MNIVIFFSVLSTNLRKNQDLEGITEIAFADSFVTIKPISKTQKKCLKLFNTSEPVSRYVQNIAVPNMIKYARKPHGDKGAK